MDDSEFVEALRGTVLGAGLRTVLRDLTEAKSGEQASYLHSLSEWFMALSPYEKKSMEKVVAHSILCGLFHTLVVLDNCDAIEFAGDDEQLGEFQLLFVKNGVSRRLGDPPDFLHDMLSSSIEIPPVTE